MSEVDSVILRQEGQRQRGGVREREVDRERKKEGE